MPVTSVTYQPATGQLLAAYRPIVFKVEATSTLGLPLPPYVVADIYIADKYYKSIIRTSAEAFDTLSSLWRFDISDALQEYLQPDIAVITNSDILAAVHASAKVMVRFRASDIDADGFTVEEGLPKPIQATKNTPSVAGSGLQSNTIFVINSALQHEDNQNMEQHLNSFKQGSWANNAFPLTHRNRYLFCPNDSDHFPIIFTGDCIDADMTLNYRVRGSNSYSSVTGSGGSGLCTPLAFTLSVTANQVTISMVSAAPAGGYFLAQYKKHADSVWIDAAQFTAPNLVFTINGSDVAGNYDLRVITFCTPCKSGTISSTFTLAGGVINKEWRGIDPYCVVQNPVSPIYIVLETRNLVTDDSYFPSDLYRTSRVQTAMVDLYAKFYSDAAHLTPVSVSESDLKIYVKQINLQNQSSSAGFSSQTLQNIISFTVDPAGVEVLLGQVQQQMIVQSYEVPWDGTGFPAVAATSTTNSSYQVYPDHQLTSGNTGFRAFANLQEYNSDTNTPILGSTKPNDSGDPDYIAPISDPSTCPAGPPTTTVSYGYDLEIAKVEIIANGASTYAQTVTDTDSGGHQYAYNIPKNTNISITVKARTLNAGNTSGFVKARVAYIDGAGIFQSESFNVPNNIETTLPQIFQNVQNINISNY